MIVLLIITTNTLKLSQGRLYIQIINLGPIQKTCMPQQMNTDDCVVLVILIIKLILSKMILSQKKLNIVYHLP